MDLRILADSIKNQVSKANNGESLETDVGQVINIIIYSVGIIAVIIIIIGGITYTMSQGDANKLKKAKDTILYGVIGLIIALLAFAIVNFVLKAIKGS